MRCDVCLTKIPPGANRCPNCGYLVKPYKNKSFNVNSIDHNHIDDRVKKRIKHKNSSINKIITILIISFSMFIVIFSIGAIFRGDSYDICDDYSTSLEQYLNDNDYFNVRITNTENDDNYESNTVEGYGYKNNISYYIKYNFVFDELYSTSITINGNKNNNNFTLKNSDIDDISEFLKIPNAYYYIKNNYHYIKNNSYTFNNESSNPSIKIQESKNNDKYIYSYTLTYKIEQD